MKRNLEQEIDELREQVEKLNRLFTDRQAAPNEKTRPDPTLAGLLAGMERRRASGESGRVAYLGVFDSGGRRSSWMQEEMNTDELLELIENRMAENVLSCIGNSDRLNILLALLREPMTVSALVSRHGYSSTGQVYHHLKPLLAADLIAEDKTAAKGTYIVQPHRVRGIIMLLTGIRDLVSPKHPEGDWAGELHGGATMVDARYMATAEESQKIIKTYFSSLDPLVLKAFPPKEKRKLVVLRVIADQFQPGRRYSEKEVNQMLKPIYADRATIRRYLIEYGFMDRTQDCSEYWLTDKRPTERPI